MDPSIFKAYDVRGLYQEQLDEQAAWKIGHATAQFLRSMVHGYDRGLAEHTSWGVRANARGIGKIVAMLSLGGRHPDHRQP